MKITFSDKKGTTESPVRQDSSAAPFFIFIYSFLLFSVSAARMVSTPPMAMQKSPML